MGKPTIKIDKLTFGFKQGNKSKPLTRPISIEAFRGQLIALIGSNGIGKSTLMRTLCQLQPSIDGQISFNGTPLGKLSKIDRAKNVSWVSTELARTGRLLVNDLVGLGRYPYSNWHGKFTPLDHQAIDDALSHVGMEAFKYRDSATLSDGEYQRVMIARALAQDTSVIILDEPTAFLDLPNKYAIVNLLHNLCRKKNKSILFSTHDLNIAMQYADKFWLLNNNGISQGAPEDLIFNQQLEKIFHESGVFFDDKIMQFKTSQQLLYPVALKGDKGLLNLVQMALNRMGFSTVCNKSDCPVVTVTSENEKIKWQLKTVDDIVSGNYIYELQEALYRYLKTKK